MIQKTGKQIDQETFTRAILEPREVSSFLEIDGSALPRLAANTIGQPTEPSSKRGKAAGYSPLDAVLMSLGRDLLGLGMSVYRTRSCLADVRIWAVSIAQHPDFGKEDSELMMALKMSWLLAWKEGDQYKTKIADLKELLHEYIRGPHSGALLTMLRMDTFVGRTLGKLKGHLGGA